MTIETAQEVAVVPQDQGQFAMMSVNEVKVQVQAIQRCMAECMVEGTDEATGHYGKIPGCGPKKVLFKAGAEKISSMFRLVPQYEIKETKMEDGHREYQVICNLLSRGVIAGSGVGSCSTMESKYRYRRGDSYTVLEGEKIPKDYKEKKKEYQRKGLGAKKTDDGGWVWVKFNKGGKVDNPDIADVYNTVLKMAKKRAHVDAVLTTTAASDIFSQDLEDNPPEDIRPEIVQPKAKATTKKETKKDDPKDISKISASQVKLLMTTYKESGIAEGTLRDIVKNIAGVESCKDIAMESLDDVLEAIKNYKADLAAAGE